MQGVSLPPPPNWLDRSMIVFRMPADETKGEFAPNITVTREDMPASASATDLPITEFANNQMKSMLQKLPKMVVQEKQETFVGGRQAYRSVFSWRNSGVRLKQMMLFADSGTGDCIMVTCTSLEDEFGSYRDVFENALSQLRIEA